jgi:chromosome partitioning protein
MQVWALANQKGGTGKTTTAINLAASLAALGKRVCLIDLDPQAHATLGLSCHVEEEGSLARLFLDGAPLATLVRSAPGGFHLVPSTLGLAEFEQVAERTLRPERILERALSSLDGRYDWVLLDCPPRADGVLCANALRGATTACLVVETGAFALQGALQARGLFEASSADAGRPLDLRFLATRFDRRTVLSRELLVAMQARFGREMLETVIRRDPALREAAAYGVPVRKLDPASRGALDHDALARELLGLFPAVHGRRSGGSEPSFLAPFRPADSRAGEPDPPRALASSHPPTD